jgi:hypothetical protein
VHREEIGVLRAVDYGRGGIVRILPDWPPRALYVAHLNYIERLINYGRWPTVVTSRREILTGVGAISLVSLAGCSAFNRSEESPDTVEDESSGTTSSTAELVNSATGRVSHKEVEVMIGTEESTLWTDAVRLTFDRDAKEVWGEYDPDYVGDSVDGASVWLY